MEGTKKSELKTKTKLLHFKTKEELEFIDFTKKVLNFVEENGVRNGLINIQSMHTTACIIVNENESLVIEDMRKNFRALAKKEVYYGHNDFSKRTENMCEGECKNGHSHCLAVYLPTSVTLNIVNGELQLGQWQRIFLVELDHDRPRDVQMLALGE